MCPREFQPAGLEAVSCGYWASGALSLSLLGYTLFFERRRGCGGRQSVDDG